MNDLFHHYGYRLASHANAAMIRDLEAFYLGHPEIRNGIRDAVDAHARAQKAKRLIAKTRDFEIFEEPFLTLPPGAGPVSTPEGIQAAAQNLDEGRPGTHPLLLFVCIWLCVGRYGGFGKQARANLSACQYLQSFCAWHGFKLPGRSTLYEIYRILPHAAIDAWLTLQGQDGKAVLDAAGESSQTQVIVADSTPIQSASSNPCHEANCVRLISRAEAALAAAEAVMGEAVDKASEDAVAKLKSQTGQLLMGASSSQTSSSRATKGGELAKKNAARRAKLLKQAQRQWCRTSQKAILHLDGKLERIEKHLATTSLDPRGRIATACDKANSALMDAQLVLDAVGDIQRHGVSVAKEHEFPFSCSDRDASFIVKGGRDTVFGYKAQLAMSSRGFIYAFHIPPGNNSDSVAYQPLLDDVMKCLGTPPRAFIVDDGYVSAANQAAAKDKGVAIPCFKGAKAKKLLGAEYDAEAQVNNRDTRSAVEGGISRGKNQHGLDRATTFGLDAVRREMTIKVMIRNFVVLRNIVDPKFTRAELYTRHAIAT